MGYDNMHLLTTASLQLGVTEAAVINAPSTKVMEPCQIDLKNISGSYVLVTVWYPVLQGGSVSDANKYDEIELEPYEHYRDMGKVPLCIPAGYCIKMKADTAAVINVFINGRNET
jgi:hypothetical protein